MCSTMPPPRDSDGELVTRFHLAQVNSIVFILASAAATTAAAQRLQPAFPTFNPTLVGPRSQVLGTPPSADHTPTHVWEGAIVGGVLTGGFTALLVHGFCEDP